MALGTLCVQGLRSVDAAPAAIVGGAPQAAFGAPQIAAGEQALVDTLPRRFSAVPLAPGVAIGPILVNGPAAAPRLREAAAV